MSTADRPSVTDTLSVPGQPRPPVLRPGSLTRSLPPFCLIDRYLLIEMATSFGLGVGVFTFVLLMSRILRLMDLIINRGFGVGVVLRMFLYILPFTLTVTIPMSVLLAGLATYGRLSSDGEAIALRMSGLSLYRLMLPSLLFGCVTTLATLWITLSLQPKSTGALASMLHRLIHTKVILALHEGVFNTDFPGLVLYVDRVDERTASLNGAMIIDQRNPNRQLVVIARSGKIPDITDDATSRPVIQLAQGTMHITSAENPDRYRNLQFETYDLQLDGGGRLAASLERPRKGKEMTFGELRAAIGRVKQEGGQVLPLLVEWHKRFALPIACLTLSLMTAPLGMRIKRASRGTSLALSVGFAVLYYILLAAGENLVMRNRVGPAIGIWFPNIFLCVIATGLVLAQGREALLPPRLRSAMAGLATSLARGASLRKA